MAIIKCPECGHQVSDKAPTCHSRGVEIAGNIARCRQCGAVYLKELAACPICNHPNDQRKEPAISMPTLQKPVRPVAKPTEEAPAKTPAKKKRHWGALLFSFLLAAVICGVCFYFYYNAKDSKETEAYTYAITSEDPLVLQSFLNTYRDASVARRDSVKARLALIQQANQDWIDACVSQSKSALQQYIDKYPESVHKGEALNKIDSIDWVKAKTTNTEDGYEEYTKSHPNGAHVDEAEEAVKTLKLKTLQPEESEMIQGLFRKFFQSINGKNAITIRETVADMLSSFLGHENVPAQEVISFMNRQWKDNVENINWHILSDYKIEKGLTDLQQTFYNVSFIARQDLDLIDAMHQKQTKYNVEAKVSAEGLITDFTISRIVEN